MGIRMLSCKTMNHEQLSWESVNLILYPDPQKLMLALL